MKKKPVFSVLVPLVLLVLSMAFVGCNNDVIEGDIDSPKAVLIPVPAKPNPNILANKTEEWATQNVIRYSFVEKCKFVSVNNGYSAKVTVAGNSIENIEILSETPLEIAQLEYNSYVEGWVNHYGTITGIYEWFLAWEQEESAKLGKNQKLHFLIRFNEQNQYPEYV